MESFAEHLVTGIAKFCLALLWDLGPWGQGVVAALVAGLGVVIWRDARGRGVRPGA